MPARIYLLNSAGLTGNLGKLTPKDVMAAPKRDLLNVWMETGAKIPVVQKEKF